VGDSIQNAGLIVLGALISFGTTHHFERRKDKRAERAERQQDERQLRQALRLVLYELVDTSAEIGWALECGQWWSDPPHDLRQRRWSTYEPILAALLDDYAWSRLSVAHAEISDFNVQLAMARDGKEVLDHDTGLSRGTIDSSAMSEAWQQSLERTHTPIRWGIEALRPIVRPDSEGAQISTSGTDD
jgi:hypothetical protein